MLVSNPLQLLLVISALQAVCFSNQIGRMSDRRPAMTLNGNSSRKISKEIIISVSPRIRNNIEISCPTPGTCTAHRGIYHKYLQVFSQHFNTKINIISSSGKGSTGLLLGNETWIGTVADVLYGDADLGIAAQTLSRNKAVRFSKAISYEFLTFVTAKPPTVYSWKAIVCPFSFQLWMFSLTTVGITVLALLILARSSLRAGRRGTKVSEVVLYCIGTFFEEPATISSCYPVRIMCGFWLIFAMIISTAYRAQLLPGLGFPSPVSPPSTVEQLVASDFQWGFVSYGGAALNYLKTSGNCAIQKLYEGMSIENDMKKCLEKCLEYPLFACVGYKTLIDVTIHSDFTDEHGQHDFIIAPEVLFSIAVGLIMRKESQDGTMLDGAIQSLQSSGIPNLWEQEDFDYLESRRISNSSVRMREADVVKLRLDQMTGAILIVVLGGFVAIVAFAWELFKYKLAVEKNSKHRGSKWSIIRLAFGNEIRRDSMLYYGKDSLWHKWI